MATGSKQRQQRNTQKHFDLLLHCHKLPFWIFDKEEHRIRNKDLGNNYCCFNHLIGLPVRNDDPTKENPLFDYQELIYNILQTHKHIWIKKATGLGVTEFFLRYIAWLCLKDNTYQNTQICIVTGPNIDIAIKLIIRLKNLFERKLGIVFPNKETVLELNKCRIEAYPSNHLDAYRALDNPKFILLDEADFFRRGELENVRHVSERYIAKSDPYIVMVSTPNMPGGLFEQIENEEEDKCLYKRIKLDYRSGLNKIYTEKEIERAKQSPAFDREYDLQYLGKIGNVYSLLSIDKAIEKGALYNPEVINRYTPKYIVIDEGFSSSKFAIIVGQWNKYERQIQILEAQELQSPLYEDAINHIFILREKYGNVLNIGFDASRPELGMSLKKKIGENYNWVNVQEKLNYCKKLGLDPATKMIVVPVPFTLENKIVMTSHSRRLLDDPRNLIAINPKFTHLITSLKAAIFDDRGVLDKEESPHNDLLDCFQMLCSFFKFKPGNEI